MVRVTGSKKLDLFVISDIIQKEEAETRIGPYKNKAFGMITSLKRAFNKHSDEIAISRYLQRFEPFWHMEGESLLEYKRKTDYQIPVKPEVRTITINKSSFEVNPANPVVTIEAEDHCFESYTKTIVRNALGGSDKKLDTYRKAPSRRIKSIKELQKNDAVVLEPTIKASYLIRDIIKDLIKPFDADKILQEKVVIKATSLFFRPIHVFELKMGSKSKTLEVCAITGTVSKSHPFAQQIASKLKEEATWFDVGTELASAVVPGAGAGVIIGKHIKDKVAHKKKLKKMQASQSARRSLAR